MQGTSDFLVERWNKFWTYLGSHLEMLHYLRAQFWWSVYLYLKLLNYSLSFGLIVDLSYFHTFAGGGGGWG